MKLTPLGKIAILLIAIGLAVGGWRFWQGSKSKIALPALPSRQGNPANPGTTDNGQNPPPQTEPAASNEIQIVSSASKKGWLNDQIDRFNAEQDGKYTVTLVPVETREAMHNILEGSVKPALWSPSSVIWADRLAEVWQQKNGYSILDTTDDASYRLVLKTPIVFLTTKEKARFLRPLLGSANGWANLKDLSTGAKKAPWGRFKWAHADPLNANSGMLTMALMLQDYAEKIGQGGSVERVAQSAGFRDYLGQIKRGFVYNKAVEQGSSALLKSFVRNPDNYDVITAYEATAMSEVINNPDLVVIYPSPTAEAENSVCVLNGRWLTPEQKAGAKEFLRFVGEKQSAVDGVKEHFRPERGASLSGELSQYAGNGFKPSYSSIELPPYTALNNAAVEWRKLYRAGG